MKNPNYFYTREQVEEIKSEILKREISPRKISERLAEKYGKNPKTFYLKVLSINKQIEREGETAEIHVGAKGGPKPTVKAIKAKKVRKTKVKNTQSVYGEPVMKEGMVITLYPKSVTIENNICKLHF